MKIETFKLSKRSLWITFHDMENGTHTVPVHTLRLHEHLIVQATDEHEGNSNYQIISDGHAIEVDGTTFIEIHEWLMG